MSFIRSVFAFLGFDRMVEAAGATVDSDDHQWRRLTGDLERDLLPVTQQRMQKLALHLWERNGLANRLIELPVAYMVGKGCRITCADQEAQQLIDRHWKDGLNCWDLKLTKRARELALFGEQCWIAFRAASGFVRFGYLDPALIDRVILDPDNVEQPIGIQTIADAAGRQRRYRVIVNVPEAAFGPAAQDERQKMTDGECLFFRVNDLAAGGRGRSDLLPLMDWLDAYDEFLYGELDRADHLRNYVWDVTIKGATAEEVATRAKQIAAPAPNSVRVHNDSEEWQAVSPNLASYEAAAGARLFRNHILGSRSLPPTWFADGEDANRANSQSMAESTERVLETRQAYLGYMLVETMRYVLRSAWGVLERDPSAEQREVLDSVRVEWPALTARDTTRYASAFQQAVAAGAQAIADNLLTRKTVVALLASLAAQIGVEVDVDQELDAVLKQRAEAGDDPGQFEPAELDTPPDEPLDA
jgi:hypothetical protein